MAEKWEIRASMAKDIAESAPMRKLNDAKKKIMEEIKFCARDGKRSYVIDFSYYDVSCLEDWSNIYNWLLKLGYKIDDNSASKIYPNFVAKW